MQLAQLLRRSACSLCASIQRTVREHLLRWESLTPGTQYRFRERGFMRISGRWLPVGAPFAPQDLFRNSEPGVHFEAYDPSSLLRRRNRFTYSEQFSVTSGGWTRANILSITENADGTGDLVVPNTTGGVAHTLSEANSSVGVSNVINVRAKAGGYSFLIIQVGTAAVWFNLSNGTVGTKSASATASISAVDGLAGYYDCTVQAVAANGNAFLFVAETDGASTFAGDGTSGIYLARAQLEWNTTTASEYQLVTDWNTEYLAAAGSNVYMYQDSAGTTATWGVEQPVGKWVDRSGNGKHATQATSASRGTLSARVNRATKSEQLDDAVYTKTDVTVTANATAAPDGNTTADLVTEGSAGTATITQADTIVAGSEQTVSVSLKRGNTDWVRVMYADTGLANGFQAWVNLGTGALGTFSARGTGTATSATLTAQANGFYRLKMVGKVAAGATAPAFAILSANADASGTRVNGATYYGWGVDLRTSNDAALSIPAYQRVNTSGDYDTDGFIHYIKFDGTDDSYATPSIDFSGVDKMAVWAGVTKTAEVGGILVELTATAVTNPASFNIANSSGNLANYASRSNGTLIPAISTTPNSYAAPHSGVVVLAAGISTDVNTLRVNGGLAVDSSADQGTGNYSNAPIYIGRRNNTSSPFPGRLTSLTVRGTTTPTSNRFIRDMEQYAARLAGQVFSSTF